MFFLLMSILCSAYLILLFKYFEKARVNTFQAIVVNYWVCAAMGFIFSPMNGLNEIFSVKSLMISGLLLGVLFISIFYLLGLTAQKIGVTVAVVANKLSLIIPVTAGFYLYNESITFLKVSGIMLAITAIFFTSYRKEDSGSKLTWLSVLLPLLVFLGSGIIDTSAKYLQVNYFSEQDFNSFLCLLFATAAMTGTLIFIAALITKRQQLSYRNIWGGIFLGIPNYGSMYFLLKTLDLKGWESTVIFPVNNIGIMALSTLCAYLFFKEKLSAVNLAGLILAIISIILIALAQ